MCSVTLTDAEVREEVPIPPRRALFASCGFPR